MPEPEGAVAPGQEDEPARQVALANAVGANAVGANQVWANQVPANAVGNSAIPTRPATTYWPRNKIGSAMRTSHPECSTDLLRRARW